MIYIYIYIYMAVSRLLSHLATRPKTDRMWLRSWYLFPTDLIPFGKTNGCFSDAPDVIFASLNWQHNSVKNGYRKNVIQKHQKPDKWKRSGFHCNLPWGDWCGHYGTTFAPLEFLKMTSLEKRLKRCHRSYYTVYTNVLLLGPLHARMPMFALLLTTISSLSAMG